MSKLINFLAVFVLMGLVNAGPTYVSDSFEKEQECLLAIFQPALDKCQSSDNAKTGDEIRNCIYKEFELLGEGSELHVDKYVEHFKSHAVSDENTTAFLSVAQKCAELVAKEEGLAKQLEEFDECIGLNRLTVSRAIGCRQD